MVLCNPVSVINTFSAKLGNGRFGRVVNETRIVPAPPCLLLNAPQSLAHVRGAADELLAKSMYVVVAHGAGLDVIASVV